MLYRLYIDFDGVMWDTWPSFYKIVSETDNELYEKMIDHTTNKDEDKRLIEIFKAIDWEPLLNSTEPINDSLIWIKELYDTGMFDITILTHCNSDNEIINKKKLTEEKMPGINIITVDKTISKATVVDPVGAILVDDYWKNLESWEEAGGIGIKFSTKEEENCAFYHISSLAQIPEIVDLINLNNETKAGKPAKLVSIKE